MADNTTTPAPQADDTLSVIGSRANALLSLAALAPGLSEAELRTALYLAVNENPATHTVVASSRQIAQATRLERKNVRRALDSLNVRCLIATRQGTATTSAAYRLNFTQTTALTGGVTITPPHALRGVTATPPPPLFPQHLGSQQPHPSEPPPPVDISISTSDSILDRLLAARPNHFDESTLADARKWVHGYMAKFGRVLNPHPPDNHLLAQLLTVAPLPTLLDLIRDLMAERQEAYSYGWFVSVALQRIHGIQPQALKARRAELRFVRRTHREAAEQANAWQQELITGLVAKTKL